MIILVCSRYVLVVVILPLWKCQRNAMLTNSCITNRDHLQTGHSSMADRNDGNYLSERLHLYPERFYIPLWKVRPKITSPDNNSSEFAWNWTCQHVSPSPVLWKARRFHTFLSTCEIRIILVIQMYPQGTGRGSLTATLWWWGSKRGCDGALVWQLIYLV